MAIRKKSNRKLALALAGFVAGMVGVAYASVPLYELFCQVTGYGGTPQVAAAAPGPVSNERSPSALMQTPIQNYPGNLKLREGKLQ